MRPGPILVLNAGSSTLKVSLLGHGTKPLLTGELNWEIPSTVAQLAYSIGDDEEQLLPLTGPDRAGMIAAVVEFVAQYASASTGRQPAAVGHRIVHGGARFQEPVVIDEEVLSGIEAISELAPLHNPVAIEAIQAARAALPEAAHFAVFDTAYYHSLSEARTRYAIPEFWTTQLGIRRYGFHGISHQYCVERAADLSHDAPDDLRVVSCHLGAGCSATASADGIAIATTMGFTPLDGLMMGTRPGSLDPGILTYAQRRLKLTSTELEFTLNHDCGMLGVSGLSSDFRQLENAADAGSARASLAIEMFADSIRQAIGALVTTLGGIDAIIFTGGIGENSAALRERVCTPLAYLGIELNRDSNRRAAGDVNLSARQRRVRVFRIHTREDLQIARMVRMTAAAGPWHRQGTEHHDEGATGGMPNNGDSSSRHQ